MVPARPLAAPAPPIPPASPAAHAHTARAPRSSPRATTHTHTHAPHPAKTQVLDGTAFSLLEFYKESTLQYELFRMLPLILCGTAGGCDWRYPGTHTHPQHSLTTAKTILKDKPNFSISLVTKCIGRRGPGGAPPSAAGDQPRRGGGRPPSPPSPTLPISSSSSSSHLQHHHHYHLAR